jgi:ubiquitin carboxyl-terminal hydrolase 10
MYLDKYMVEVVEGYKCEKCKDSSKKQRVLLIRHSPDILTVQLKRFNWDGTKINTPVRIPTTLDLEEYRDVGNDHSMRYQLTAVIKHAGSGGFGHYICDAKAGDGEWYRFDDDTKSKCSAAEATSSLKSGFTPYILFFRRKQK